MQSMWEGVTDFPMNFSYLQVGKSLRGATFYLTSPLAFLVFLKPLCGLSCLFSDQDTSSANRLYLMQKKENK